MKKLQLGKVPLSKLAKVADSNISRTESQWSRILRNFIPTGHFRGIYPLHNHQTWTSFHKAIQYRFLPADVPDTNSPHDTYAISCIEVVP
jgi:hypothetical protein